MKTKFSSLMNMICSWARRIFCRRFGIVQMTIVILALFGMSVIWPMGVINVSEFSGRNWDGMRFSGPCNETDIIRQEFSPMFSDLRKIGIYVCNEPDSIDTMKVALRLYTYDGQCISENTVNLENYELPGWVSIPVVFNEEIKEFLPGTLYYYTIGGLDGDLIIGLSNDETKTAENGFLYYKEVYSGGTTIATEFEYTRPLGLKKILFYDGIIALVTVAILTLIQYLFDSFSKEKTIKAEKITKIIICALLGVVVALSFYGIVVKHLFINDVLNTSILFVGTLLLALFLCYFVISVRSCTDVMLEDQVKEIWIRVIRSSLFACALIMTCMYQNGFSDYEKNLYVCRLIVFLGLFIFSFCQSKQIWSIPSLGWSAISLIGGCFYVRMNNDHIEHITTAKAISWAAWAIGLVVMTLVYKVKNTNKSQYRQICVPIVVTTLIFWIMCVVLAKGKTWPIVLLIMFLTWFVFYWLEADKSKVVDAICNGSIEMFFLILVFCLYRRPYHFYFFNRYGGMFFTVTVTATMYLVPIAAICVKLIKARQEDNMKKIILYTSMFGVIFSYMLFTATRTGLISSAVLLVIAFLIPLKGHRKNFFKKQLQLIGISLGSLLSAFVVAFSATRMIPAMIANPYYYPYEDNCDVIVKDTPWNGGPTWDMRYIEIERVLETLTGRVFDTGNNQFVSLEELNSSEEETNQVALIGNSELVSSYSNGRLEIFKAYLSKLNMWGHDSMTLVADNGEELYHAHNSYIQVLYDFGIPVGILFIILCGIVFIRSIIMFIKKASEAPEYSFILLIVSAFGLASMTEWLYHPFTPLGFMFLICWSILMCRIDGEKKENV